MATMDGSGFEREAMDAGGHSVVAACGVSACRNNQDGQCRAGTIHIAFVEGMAHCATFMPGDADEAVGVSGVSMDMGGANAI